MRNSYDLIAAQWHATASQRSPTYITHVLRLVDRVLAGLPIGAQILDLGCGTGEPIDRHIAARGYSVTCLDQSAEMLKFARHNIPADEFIHADMVDVEFSHNFDGAIAWDSMFHVNRRHHAAIYRKVAQALMPGRRFMFSVGGSAADEKDNSVEGFTSEMFGQTFYYSGFAPEVARKLIEEAGFEIELWEIDDPTSRGHIAGIARRLP